MSRLHRIGANNSHCATLAVLLCAIVVAGGTGVAYDLVRQHRYVQRGVSYSELRSARPSSDNLYGVNVALEQYGEGDLQRAFTLIHGAGFGWLRQRFPWADVEPRPGQYDWSPWDELVAEANRNGLRLIAVLDTSPGWARSPADLENRLAPPQHLTTYGLFVRAFAGRYSGQIAAYEVWDQPNIAPCWGARDADPGAYARLLRIAATEIRRADPSALVLSAALAPNSEAGGRNMSEVLFLRGMYAAGAKSSFDVLGAKAYGFWSGPEDRRVDLQVLNFSRLILLREEMLRQGDPTVPVWAVESGWNALPADWPGPPPPWGTDDIDKQSDRTLRSIQRARQEWGWVEVICAPALQPAVPPDDSQWGFALLAPDSQPTAFYGTWQSAISASAGVSPRDDTTYGARLLLILLVVAAGGAIFVGLWGRSSWAVWLQRGASLMATAPELWQWALLGLALVSFYVVPSPGLSLALLALALWLVRQRLDIGLALLVFSVPFFLYPKSLLGKGFSMVEILTVLCVAAWLWRIVSRAALGPSRLPLSALLRRGRTWLRSLSSLDSAAMAFVAVAALSLLTSDNRGVSIREFRVIVIEPVLLYLLLRHAGLDRKQLLRLPDALLLAGVAVSMFGLYQYTGRGDVIVTEGVRRVHAVYASPNNLSLFLGRVIPLAMAMLATRSSSRRLPYGLALLPLLAGMFLTFSRGGWLLSLPAGLLTIGLLRGRRAALAALLVMAIVLLAILPLLGTRRLASLLDVEQGTTFRRLRLWQAAVSMLRDHPLTGVGLDNFLYQYPEYMLSDAWQEPGLSHPHNVLLDWWLRLGIAGVAVLVWLVVAFFAAALRLHQRLADGDARAMTLGFGASMSAALVHGLIDHSYFLVDLAFVFFLSLGWVRAMTLQSWPEPAPCADAGDRRDVPG